MTENWKVQVSPKLADGTLVNVRAESPAELAAIIEQLVQVAPAVASLPSHLNGVGVVATGLGGTVVDHQAAPPPQQATATNPASWNPPAPQQAAPQGGGPRVETNQWGASFEHDHPSAPITPQGVKAVLKRATSQQGKAYARWIDPRSKDIPSNRAAGVRQDPADLWPGDFARGV